MSFAASADGRGEGRRRAGHRDRVEGVPQPRFRRAASARCKQPVIFDGRNLYEPAVVRAHGLEYYPIGARGRRDRSVTRCELPDFARARVLVVGDVMLDRYWFGDVSRISPEAPVPVVHVKRTEERPGGAANVARNVTALGAQARAARGGRRRRGRRLARAAAGRRARRSASLHRDAALSHHGEAARDRPAAAAAAHRLRARAQRTRCSPRSSTITSAWSTRPTPWCCPTTARAASRTCRRMIERRARARQARAGRSEGRRLRALPRRHAAHAQPRRVPRGRRALERRGRPRAPRAEAARASSSSRRCIVTRSEEGMSLFTATESQHEPTQAREVFDVSGAGDTVIARARADGGGRARTCTTAMRVANHAAGIVVGKLGTAVVHRDELAASLVPGTRPMAIIVTGAAGFIGSNLVKALNARGETRHRRGRQPVARRQGRATWPTSRSPTTSTSATSSSASTAATSTARSRGPAPGRLLGHDGDRRALHDGEQLRATRWRCSSWCQARGDPLHLRLVGLGVRRGPACSARRASTRRRSTSTATPSSCSTRWCAASCRETHRAGRGLPLLQRLRPARGAQGAHGLGRVPLLQPVPRATGACKLFEGSAGYGPGEQMPRLRLGGRRGDGEPLLPRPSRDLRASSTSAPAARRASTRWRAPPSTRCARAQGEKALVARGAACRGRHRVHRRSRRSSWASTRASPRPTDGAARRGLRRRVPLRGGGRGPLRRWRESRGEKP